MCRRPASSVGVTAHFENILVSAQPSTEMRSPADDRGAISAPILRTEHCPFDSAGSRRCPTSISKCTQQDPRHHRAERRRQEHVFQLSDGRAAADRRPHRLRRRRDLRPGQQCDFAKGHRTLLSDHQYPAQRHGAGERPHRRAIAPARLEHDRASRRFRRHQRQGRSALDSVGLLGKAENLRQTLSHGEQRNLEIGIALATEPKLLCLDEPTAGMSQAETDETKELVAPHRQDTNLTILIVEHDMQVVMRALRPHHGAALRRNPCRRHASGNSENPKVLEVYLKT